jgi:hypothetical protein
MMLVEMPTTQELKTRIKALRTQKTQLANELNVLKLKLATKTLNSEQQKDVTCSVEEFVAVN